MVSITASSGADAREAQVFWLRPNRALSLRGVRRVAAALVAYVMLVALASSLAGNAYAPLFALLVAAAVAVAFTLVWRRGQRGERITLSDQALEIARFPAAGPSLRLQPYWVRVRLQPGHHGPRLTLVSHGRTVEIGAFLGEEERETVRCQLQDRLTRLRQPPHLRPPAE